MLLLFVFALGFVGGLTYGRVKLLALALLVVVVLLAAGLISVSF